MYAGLGGEVASPARRSLPGVWPSPGARRQGRPGGPETAMPDPKSQDDSLTLSEAVEVVSGGEVMGTSPRLHPMPGQTQRQFRAEELRLARNVIEGWRAYLAEGKPGVREATRLAYRAAAYEHDLWPDACPLDEGRTFLADDDEVRGKLERMRGRVLRELGEANPGDADLNAAVESLRVNLRRWGELRQEAKRAAALIGSLQLRSYSLSFDSRVDPSGADERTA